MLGGWSHFRHCRTLEDKSGAPKFFKKKGCRRAVISLKADRPRRRASRAPQAGGPAPQPASGRPGLISSLVFLKFLFYILFYLFYLFYFFLFLSFFLTLSLFGFSSLFWLLLLLVF